MLSKKSLRLGMVFVLLVFIGTSLTSFTVPATAANSMVGECLKDQTMCQDNDKTDAETEKTESASVSISAWDYIKIFFSLILVLGLLVFVLKFLNKRNKTYQQNSTIRNIGGITVGAQKSVQVVQVGKHLFVVGVGDEVQLIKEISDSNEVEQLLKLHDDKQVFASTKPYIFELLSSKKKQQPVETTSNFEQQFKKRIEEIKKERTEEIEQWQDKERDRP